MIVNNCEPDEYSNLDLMQDIEQCPPDVFPLGPAYFPFRVGGWDV